MSTTASNGRPKTALVIQGDARCAYLDTTVRSMGPQFDHVIVATWPEDAAKMSGLPGEIVVCRRPPNGGVTNRNNQRVSTATGLRRAAELGCDFALKWRTDLAAANWNTARMLDLVTHKPPARWRSRLLMSAFRINSVDPDWFSSLPDLYAFGDIKLLQLLWRTDGVDFARNFNVPAGILSIPGLCVEGDRRITWDGRDITGEYDTHIELYALLKAAMEERLGRAFRHTELVRDYLVPLEHERLRICWFKAGEKLEFRAIRKGCHIKWTREKDWRRGYIRPPMRLRDRLTLGRWGAFLNLVICLFNERWEKTLQRIWFRRILRRLERSGNVPWPDALARQ